MAENDHPGTTGSAETARDGGADGEDSGVVTARERFQRLSQDVQGRYEKVSDDVRRGAERASSEIRRGAEAAREGYDRVREGAREGYDKVREGAREGYDKVREGAREGYDKVREHAGDWSRDLSYYVRDNPGKAVLIAAGVGFLFGLLVRRGRDEEDEG